MVGGWGAIAAEVILAIPTEEPERLFGADSSRVAEAFRCLAKRWHPDANPAPPAGEVFRHVVELHASADRKVAADRWEVPGLLRIADVAGRVFLLRFRTRHSLDLGEVYVGRGALAYATPRDADDLAEAADAALDAASALPAPMAAVYARRMPRLLRRVTTADRTFHVFGKTDDQILLRDWVAHSGGRLEPRTAAWVTSEIESLACVLGALGLAHAGLSADTVLVSPRHHALALAGGFAYAARIGGRIAGAPAGFVAAVPPAILRGGEATEALTVEAARIVAAAALGHRTPASARFDDAIPPLVRGWLTSPNPGTAALDYAAWAEARDGAYGPRRFVEARVAFDDVYPPL